MDQKVLVILRKIIKTPNRTELDLDRLISNENLKIEYEQKSLKAKVTSVLETI